MKKTVILSIICLVWFESAFANDQLRDWAFADGTKRQAEIIEYNEAGKMVTLRLPDQSLVKHGESDFSTLDRAWILEWIEKDEEARALLAKIGGSVTEQAITCADGFVVHCAVYQPQAAAAGAKPPMLILFHPGGNGRRQIYQYCEAAAAVGINLVSLDYFRNNKDPGVSEEMLQRFKSLLPQIEAAVPHDPNRIYMGGISGGANRAYHYSAWVERPWAGIFAAGGWLGGREKYDLPYPAMRVAMVNGDKDKAANSWIDGDSACLQKAGCVVSVHAFEGGHQLAPPSVQEKALRWLLTTELPAQAVP